MQAERGAEVTRLGLRVRAALLAAGIIALDQVTKSLVVEALALGESRAVLGRFLYLSHFRNTGAAFGMLRGFGGVLALAALVGVIVFGAIIVRHPTRLTAIAAAFVAGGAMGNLLDRLFREGGVVDFVDFRFWPAFNVADSAITIGALLLLWTGFKPEKATTRKDDADAAHGS